MNPLVTYQTVIAPEADPIHLDEAKAYCKVETADDDAVISELIRRATGRALTVGRRVPMLTVFDVWMDGWPAADISRSPGVRSQEIVLPCPPVRKVESVRYRDTDGAWQTLAADQYEVDLTQMFGVIVPAYGVSWPDTYGQINSVRVRFRAGFLVPFTVDASTDVITAKNHPLANEDPAVLTNSGGALPAGSAKGVTYYARDVSGDTLKVETAVAGGALDFTGAGTGRHFLGELPANLAQAILTYLATWYDNRVASDEHPGIAAGDALLMLDRPTLL